MDPASDEFLVTLAELSAGLTGLFLVGMIFYIQSGYESNEHSRQVVEPYFRAATAITLVAYAIPLAVSLTLVALPIVWSRLLFIVLVVVLIVENITTVSTVRGVLRVAPLPLLVLVEVVGSAAVAAMVIVPFATGGLFPGREDLVPSLLISLGIAFLSTVVLVLTLFDIARFERSELPVPAVSRAMRRMRRAPRPPASATRPDPSSSARPDDEDHPEVPEGP